VTSHTRIACFARRINRGDRRGTGPADIDHPGGLSCLAGAPLKPLPLAVGLRSGFFFSKTKKKKRKHTTNKRTTKKNKNNKKTRKTKKKRTTHYLSPPLPHPPSTSPPPPTPTHHPPTIPPPPHQPTHPSPPQTQETGNESSSPVRVRRRFRRLACAASSSPRWCHVAWSTSSSMPGTSGFRRF